MQEYAQKLELVFSVRPDQSDPLQLNLRVSVRMQDGPLIEGRRNGIFYKASRQSIAATALSLAAELVEESGE